jgi:multidrug resistance efflux pump
MTESQREAQEVIDKARRIQPVESTSGQSKTQARQNLDKARADLEAAKQVRTGARQGTATGGSRLTPQYTQRVQAAAQRVQEAEQQLEQAR